jgi:hypothetical protein
MLEFILLIMSLIIIYYLFQNKQPKPPINNKIIKIIIVGGGWAGISTAYVLSHYKKFNITLIEKENKIGGEAVSTVMKNCNVEYNGQIYYDLFYCVKKILKDSNLENALCPINPTIILNNKNYLSLETIFDKYNSYELLKYYGVDDITCLKFFYLLLLPPFILETFYTNTSFTDYLNNYDVFKMICGPLLGLESKKVCVATVINIIRDRIGKNTYGLNKTACAPSNFMYNHLKTFLESRGVNIRLNTECTELIKKNNKITKIKINHNSNNTYLDCDEVILSCSLNSLIHLFKKFNDRSFNKQLINLTSCLQNYFEMNLYFSEPLGLAKNYILLEQPWQPSIETKRTKNWVAYIKSSCNSKIKDVWSVGVIDFYKGYNGKILRECSLEEAIDETINQMMKNNYISKLKSETGKTFKDLLIGAEAHNFWRNKNGKIYTTNPKFSLNINSSENLLDFNYKSIPNVWFANYCCKPALRFGSSMEISSYIGFKCSELICDKYNLKLPLEINKTLMSFSSGK